tara:strand:- start:147 stop:1073 length:927 start_codon:yes stop_codon:yes gene_type:complete
MIIPWCEKYRPTNFNDIILEDNNKKLLSNIINENSFPNLLFHGPPGTGKTTTIINLINSYQEKYNEKNKSLVIHLNASDDRGIDIIRNNIYNFVNSKNLFYNGTKFVILDEVDYMTRSAQLALKCLIQEYTNIKYCLICNYISKIEINLQNEFIKVRFNKLSEKNIYDYLYNILVCENINISQKKIYSIINYFEYDIRSMVNFLQSNSNSSINIIQEDIYKNLLKINLSNDNYNIFLITLETYDKKYKINKIYILKFYILYVIKKIYCKINNKYLNILEQIIHNIDNIYSIKYTFYVIKEIYFLVNKI